MTDLIDQTAEAAPATEPADGRSRSAFSPLAVKSVDHLTED